jgi:hypothetical protein
MVAVPTIKPLMKPGVAAASAITGSLLLHVPPGTGWLRKVERLSQMVSVPVSGATAVTVTMAVAMQPDAAV